jgi:hypothetical protein
LDSTFNRNFYYINIKSNSDSKNNSYHHSRSQEDYQNKPFIRQQIRDNYDLVLSILAPIFASKLSLEPVILA